REPTITFVMAEKKLNGNSICNNFAGSVKIEGQALWFVPLIARKMACRGNREQVFFKNIERVTGFDVQSESLTMLMHDIVVMRWKKKQIIKHAMKLGFIAFFYLLPLIAANVVTFCFSDLNLTRPADWLFIVSHLFPLR